jgi:hypothetical protein
MMKDIGSFIIHPFMFGRRPPSRSGFRLAYLRRMTFGSMVGAWRAPASAWK